ncbi:MAG: 3-isopropylmalate dehydrogenase [Pseudomonadota bacterium]
MAAKVVFLPGDGVGPEVADAALMVLTRAAAKFDVALEIEHHAFGGAGIDGAGDPLPDETKEACMSAAAIFLGAVGGPKWDGATRRPEMGLLELRKALGVYANLRPVKVLSGLESFSPIREERVRGADMVFVRELTGGVYFGKREEGDARATDECLYTVEEVTRVARTAFEAARARRGRVVSVDKANVLATSRLWRKAVTVLHEAEYSDVALSHQLVDSMAMKLITDPASFDVILTENMFGDILSDEASVIGGSIGLAPSASLGDGGIGLYEPIHGSAPDIAGEGKANPVGAILSAAMLLRYSLNAPEAAARIDEAVEKAITEGARTGDLGGNRSTNDVAEWVVSLL